MKRLSFIAACLALSMAFAASAFGQPAAAAGKIGLINVNAFGDEKAGITKFRNALLSLDPEFKPLNDELNGLRTKYQTLAQEIQKLQQPAPAGVPAANNQATLAAKVEEAQNLEVTIKRKQEDGKTKYERRYAQVVAPVFNDIIKGLNEFAKAKGYAVILDGAKLEQEGILMGFDDKYDVTKEFIAFYNARPAGTATNTAASATPPKNK